MTDGRDERLGLLAEELGEALAAGEHIDIAAWADRFDVETPEVEACVRALRAFDSCLGEELAEGRPELPLPELPDSFEIEGELGRGGMGVVYRASQPALGRTVAVKVLRPGELRFGEALQRFRDEARSLARLRHRHIVSIHDVGETPEGLLWYAMDLVEGCTLADEIETSGALTPSRATRVIGQITSAIAHAHAQGIVHRDLKPQNVLIDDAGDAYVVDFGLARDASTAGTRTMTGELLGTPAYMSPEQASGDHGRIGEPTDIWALGALLYESLTGRGPFSGRPLHETIRAILEEEPRPARKVEPRVPAGLEAVCAMAMRKKPEQRYPTALALGEELERFADGRGVQARSPSVFQRLGRAAWRHRTIVAAGAAVALFLMVLFGLVIVPNALQESRVADARTAFESGYAGAVIEPLREVAAGLDEAAPPWHALNVLFLQSLNARTAELLADDQLDAALELHREARAIVEPGLRSHQVDPQSVSIDERESWQFELMACRVLSHHPALKTNLEPLYFNADARNRPLYRSQFERAWTHPNRGRRLLARSIAWSMHGSVALASVDPKLRPEVLIEIHRRLGERIRAGFDSFSELATFAPMGWDAEQLAAWWSPDVEEALADLAINEQADAVLRGLALRMLSRFAGLPCAQLLRNAEQDLVGYLELRAAAAPTIISLWRSWRGLTREAALRARIDALVASLDDHTFVDLPSGRSLALTNLGLWLGAGSNRLGAKDLRALWEARRLQPAEKWVREALEIPTDREISCSDAMMSAETAPRRPAVLWRHLAWLRLPKGARVPELIDAGAPYAVTRAWLGHWRAASGDEVMGGHVVRMGVLLFPDIGAAPVLLGEAEQVIAAGAEVDLRWRGSIPIDFGPRAWGRDYGEESAIAQHRRSSLALPPAPREVLAELRCRLEVTNGDLQLNPRAHALRCRIPMDGGVHASRSRGGAIGIGDARAVEFTTTYGGSLAATTELVLLVRIDAADDLPQAGDVNAWREGVLHALRNLADRGGVSSATLTHFDLMSRWPMPEAAESLDALAADRPEGSFAALWNAGVATDSDAPVPVSNDPRTAMEWATVALKAPTPALRKRGRQMLGTSMDREYGTSLSPRGAELLLDQRGDEIEPELAAKLRARRDGHVSPWLGRRLLIGIGFAFAAVIGLAVAFLRHSSRGAWLAWSSATILTFFQFETDWFVGPPIWTLLAFAALAGVRVASTRGSRSPRLLAIGVPSLLAIWSYAAVNSWASPPPHGAIWLMLLPVLARVSSAR